MCPLHAVQRASHTFEKCVDRAIPKGVARVVHRGPCMRARLILLVPLLCLTPAPSQAQMGTELDSPSTDSSPHDEPPLRQDAPRLRFGITAGPWLGWTVGSSSSSSWFSGTLLGGPSTTIWMGLHLHARVGVQISDLVGLYYSTGGLFGVDPLTLNTTGYGADGTDGQVTFSNSVFLDFTIDDRYQLGLGAGAWVATFVSVAPGWHAGPGLSPRFAITSGGEGEGTRQGFTIATQLDAVWLPSAATHDHGFLIAVSVQAGWETF